MGKRAAGRISLGYSVAHIGATRMKCAHKWVVLCEPIYEGVVETRQYRCDVVGCFAVKREREWVQNGVSVVADVVDDDARPDGEIA